MNCKIVGYDFKSLEVELNPLECFYCEKGAIVYHEEGIEKNVKVMDKGLTGLLKRKLSGESIFLMELTNRSNSAKKLLISGKMGLLPLDLKSFDGQIVCRAGLYVASTKNVDVDFSLNLSSLISNSSLMLQKITGDATVFLDTFGVAVRLDVKAGSAIEVDEKHFICINAQSISQLQSKFSGAGFLGGEGLTMYRITGNSTVYVSTQKRII
ncbi:MAG: AIM24 family protein [Prevotellaceae bacterium]|jgi:uncharacterized protein (AIM24 family)|nr:AIM24 family protein [Prevotellaceae bacterium]